MQHNGARRSPVHKQAGEVPLAEAVSQISRELSDHSPLQNLVDGLPLAAVVLDVKGDVQLMNLQARMLLAGRKDDCPQSLADLAELAALRHDGSETAMADIQSHWQAGSDVQFRRFSHEGELHEWRGKRLKDGRYLFTIAGIATREVKRANSAASERAPRAEVLAWPSFVQAGNATLAAGRFTKSFVLHYIRFTGLPCALNDLAIAQQRELIALTGGRIAQMVRSEDLVGHVGGLEFAVLQTGVEQTPDIARLQGVLRLVTNAPFPMASGPMSLQSRVGFSTSPQQGCDVETLRSHARAGLEARSA